MESEQSTEVVSENKKPSALQTLHTVTPLSKYLAMALFVVLPFLGGWIGYNLAPEKVVEVEMTAIDSEDQIPEDADLIRNIYETERLTDSEYGGECGDSSLVYYDVAGNRNVVEESLGAIVAPLQLDERNHLCKGSMGMVTFHLGEGKVFLKQNNYEGGRCLGGALYEYDVNTGILRYLNVNSSLGQLCVLSPDNTRIASTRYESFPYVDDPTEYAYQAQEIVIADLLSDSSFIALDLNNEEETFVGPRDGYGPFGRDTFEWIDLNTLEYKIYDVATTEYGNGNWGHPYLESRILSLAPIDQDLQTFRSEEYGFEFKYLSDKYLYEDNKSNVFNSFYVEVLSSFDSLNGSGVSIAVSTAEIEEYVSDLQNSGTVRYEGKQIINGIKWDKYQYIFNEPTHATSSHIWLRELDQNTIRVSHWDFVDPKIILDTLQIIDDTDFENSQNESGSIESWTQYQDNELGFGFSYPNDWGYQEWVLQNQVLYVSISPGIDSSPREELPLVDVPLGLVTFSNTEGKCSQVNAETEQIDVQGKENSFIAIVRDKITENNEPNARYANKHLINVCIDKNSDQDQSSISINYVSELDDEYLDEFWEILKTLNFNL